MMTREEKLIAMRGVDLIEVGEKLGLKITKNDLKKGKVAVVKQILEAEADKEWEESAKPAKELQEAPIEVPKTQNKEPKKEAKQKPKTEAKKANLKLTELTYKGETKSIREWAEELKMPWPTLYDRVNRNGWSIKDAIEIPLGQRRSKVKKEEK